MGYYNGKKVLSVVAVEYLNPNGTIKLTENGSYDVRAYKKAVVSVFPSGTIQKIEDEGVAQGAGAFPSTILSKGLFNYVGGMSQKVNQLVKNGNFASVSNWTITGATYSVSNNEAVITMGGANFNFYQAVEKKPSHKYLIKYDIKSSINLFGFSLNWGNSVTSHSITTSYASHSLMVSDIGGNNNLNFTIYGTGVANEKVYLSNIKLIDLTDIYGAGNEPTTTSDPRISQLVALLKKYPQYNEGSIVNAKVTNLLSTDGTNETNYPIPAEVQALDGYGLGIDDTLYNHIDFERKKFVKKVGSYTFTGNENFESRSVGRCYTPFANIIKEPETRLTPANMICNTFTNVGDGFLEQGNLQISYYRNQVGFCLNRTADSGDIDALKNYLRTHQTTIVFELATPTETDISEYLDRDFPNENLIDLYADGKVYFENENNMGVPYSITYQERIN